MARHKKTTHGNSERWLVSYADLVTLLFAFFVVMFASTQTDKARAKEISQAVNKALQGSSLPPSVSAILGGAADDKGRGSAQLRGPARPAGDQTSRQLDLNGAIQELQKTLSAEMKQGQVKIHLEERGAVISLNTQVVFSSGGDTIDRAIYPLLAKVSVTLNQLPNPLRLEGYTDSIPINNERFHNNWELSAARSIAMLRILNERYGVDRERLAEVGYADTNAVGDNQTEEGRMQNRRVDLVILGDFGKKSEPPGGDGGRPAGGMPQAVPCPGSTPPNAGLRTSGPTASVGR